MNKKALILLSGGIDSATCLAIAKSQNYDCYALSFDYGQKHSAELAAAKKIARAFNVIEHRIFPLPINHLGGSPLIDPNLKVPDFDGSTQIAPTYVPARNTIFLSIALAWAEVLGSEDLFYGSNKPDYSGYPDCRPEYFEAFAELATLATKVGVEQNKKFKIHTPLIFLDKHEIIQLATKLGVDFRMTFSCYRPDENARSCGKCLSCALRRQGFTNAGMSDAIHYQE